MTETLRYSVLPGRSLELTGEDWAHKHFREEYGVPCEEPPALRVRMSASGSGSAPWDIVGAHKSVSWAVALGDPSDEPLAAWVSLRGRPRWFALSLVQGYIIEPLLAIAAARDARVLLPAAAIAGLGGATLLIGRSRSGKSSVSVRALASGLPVLGDDHVVVGPGAIVTRFPRRIRVYDDIAATNPDAWRSFAPSIRWNLRLRRVLRTATRGLVAPSLALSNDAIRDQAADARTLSLARVVAIHRSPAAQDLVVTPVTPRTILVTATGVIADQRRHLASSRSKEWAQCLGDALELERRSLADAIASVPTFTVDVPDHWGAVAAVNALATALAIGNRRP